MRLTLSFFAFVFFLPQCVLGQVFRVGPGYRFKDLRAVGWDRLRPGDIVEIYSRPTPYREKFILRAGGTKKNPIIIRGISDNDGNRPVIDGENAQVFQKINIGLSKRALIIVGGSEKRADHIILDNLELRNANNTQTFIYKGKKEPYADNGAAVFVQNGRNVTIRNCIIHSCCMGVQTAYYPNVDHFILRSNHIYNNGDFTKKRWGHNVYLQGKRTLIEFNRFGELYSDGNNIKDRSQMVIIRYNWIEGGQSRQIDLVESLHYPVAHAYVYGNVIISGQKTVNPKMILYGGDLPKKNTSRSGTLYFYNNTIRFRYNRMDAFIYMNRADCTASIINNAFFGGGLSPSITMGPGRVTGTNNLIQRGSPAEGLLNSFYGGLEQIMGTNFFPYSSSLLVNNGVAQLPLRVKYIPAPKPNLKIPRRISGPIDIGAYESTYN